MHACLHAHAHCQLLRVQCSKPSEQAFLIKNWAHILQGFEAVARDRLLHEHSVPAAACAALEAASQQLNGSGGGTAQQGQKRSASAGQSADADAQGVGQVDPPMGRGRGRGRAKGPQVFLRNP